jgi:hypothetical protein
VYDMYLCSTFTSCLCMLNVDTERWNRVGEIPLPYLVKNVLNDLVMVRTLGGRLPQLVSKGSRIDAQL